MSRRARSWLIGVGIVCGFYGLCAITIYAIHFTEYPWQD